VSSPDERYEQYDGVTLGQAERRKSHSMYKTFLNLRNYRLI